MIGSMTGVRLGALGSLFDLAIVSILCSSVIVLDSLISLVLPAEPFQIALYLNFLTRNA